MKPLRLVVLGTLAGNPYAGMAWMQMQLAAGLRRLGHDVHYLEATSCWPYDPVRRQKVNDSEYAVPYLERVAERFGLGDRWAYRRSFSDRVWLGPSRGVARELLRRADAVFNVTGATHPIAEGLEIGRLVYYGTDPLIHEIAYSNGRPLSRTLIDAHHDCVTYGENIGTPACPVPPLPRLRARTRQPILLDEWAGGPPARGAFTTVGNWRQAGLDMDFQGQTYLWSKHHEFLKFLELPRRVGATLELATNRDDRRAVRPDDNEDVPALGLGDGDHGLLKANGWRVVGAAFTADPSEYQGYLTASRGEFTVARDLHVRLKSGWFSERSACYLAAGRPVITQDTGFGAILPTGEGLFAFSTMDDALAAFDAVNSDYPRHSRAARAIAEEYFRAETVLSRMLADLGF
ncbi:MAG TPA: hypothetical protein VKD90_13440 [Gemmataceae bacterium]|nr:hypothetical protein [Gemmataceae bacterium]